MQIDPRLSPVPALQQLRTLHPGALQHLQQSPDGSIYPHHQAVPQPVYPQPQYALSGPPHPPPHAIQYQHHGLPGPPQPAQYAAFPATYQHVSSPRFSAAQQLQSPPQPVQQQVPLPTPPPPRPASQQVTVQAFPQHIQQHAHPENMAPRLGLEAEDAPPTSHSSHFQGLKMVAEPPDLDEWRQRLFDVDDAITLSEEDFNTYFPHIDNVYSHRSTQRHKRKRFVSHYWDCRLKGRPPGTKKSTDPDKKKRKRVARERDLCDVKIKITEYFDQDEYAEQLGHNPPGAIDDTANANAVAANIQNVPSNQQHQHQQQFFGVQQRDVDGWEMPTHMAQAGMPPFTGATDPPPLRPPKKFYTFQRVNGNGGNGKGDGVAGPHKHTLEESDRVKKNSVVRWLAKCEKDDRRKSHGGDATKKTYHKKATGNALITVKNHSKEDDLKLYGSAFCPFVQRVWISLEHKRLSYQYIEVDPYRKPASLLAVNPRGLVPAIRHGPNWSTHESTVIMEYLEDMSSSTSPALLPRDPQLRATQRLWTDHVNRNIIPHFYKLLQAQDTTDQITHATELRTQISTLVDAAHPTGPFFLGPELSFVDVQIAPWVVRLRKVLAPYRGWPEPEEGSRWKSWVEAIEGAESVRSTMSGDELYLDSYERYAENRPGTSQVADAINSGRGLP